MDKNLLIRFFEGQATTDEEMKVRKWMEASTENRRTYFKERKMYDMTLLLSKDTKKETVSQSSKKKFKFRKFIEIAAVAAITLVITLFYKNQENIGSLLKKSVFQLVNVSIWNCLMEPKFG